MEARRDLAEVSERDGQSHGAVTAHAEVTNVVEENDAGRAGRVGALAEQSSDERV